MESLPIWTATPNWKESVLERLEWKTGVLVSTSGAEQRIGVRATPRRSFEIATWAHGPDRAWLDHAIHAAGASRWYVPLFHDPAALLSAGATDDTTIYCDTEGREFRAGGYAILRGATPFVAEAVEIVSAGAGSLALAAPGLTRDWPAGTRIWPAEKGRIAEMPVLTRKGDRTADVRLRFDLEGAQEWTAATLAAGYEGLPVLTTPPNERESITHEHARIMSLFTTDLAAPVVADTAGVGLVVQMHHWMLTGRDEHNDFRSLLYALAGRRVPLWLPTFMADLTLAAPVADTDEEIVVAMCGCSTFGVPRSGREHIAIQFRSGPNIYAQVIAAAAAPGGATEILTLAAPLGVNVDPADVTRISWMAKARLDQDSVEITHHTDTMGVSSVSAAFRTTPETRVAEPWSPVPLLNIAMVAGYCGDYGCCQPAPAGDPFLVVTPPEAENANSVNVIPFASGTGFAVVHREFSFAYANGFSTAVSESNTPSTPEQNGISGGFVTMQVGAGLSGGGFVVLATTTHSGNYAVQATRYGADGVAVGAGTLIYGDPVSAPDSRAPAYAVAADGSNGYYMASVYLGDIIIRRYNSTDALVGSEVVVDSRELPSGTISLVNNGLIRLSDGKLVVFYTKDVAAHPNALKNRLSFRILNSDLTFATDREDVSEYEHADDTCAEWLLGVKATGIGARFGVVFERDDAYGSNTGDIRARFFGSDGEPESDSVVVAAINEIESPVLGAQMDRYVVSATIGRDGCVTMMERMLTVQGEATLAEARLSSFQRLTFEYTESQVIPLDEGFPVFTDTLENIEGVVDYAADGSLIVGYFFPPNEAEPAYRVIRSRRFSLAECMDG